MKESLKRLALPLLVLAMMAFVHAGSHALGATALSALVGGTDGFGCGLTGGVAAGATVVTAVAIWLGPPGEAVALVSGITAGVAALGYAMFC
jgi:hypothetical protein